MFVVFPRDNPQQLLRLRRLMMAVGSYALMIALTGVAVWLGLLPSKAVLHILAAGVVVNVALYAVIRSDLNLRFRDPSLTAAQIAAPLVMVSYGMYYADAARGSFLMVYLVVILFGLFRLRRRDILMLGAFALVCFGIVIKLSHVYKPHATRLIDDLLQWLVLAAVLPWFAMLAGYLNNLRRTMHERNLELQSALARIQELATRDALTGTNNRRHLMEQLQQEKSRSGRSQGSLCVCIIDIDHFKAVNDRFGHVVGDTVLKTFARVAQTDLRATDCLGRYGGEEFLLILPGTTLETAQGVAERMRLRIEQATLPELGDRGVTASFGVAEYRAPEDIMACVARADKALYEAKAAGRNRVVVATG